MIWFFLVSRRIDSTIAGLEEAEEPSGESPPSDSNLFITDIKDFRAAATESIGL